MEKLFVPFELAVKLKEKGFNEAVIATYDKFSGEIHYVIQNNDPILKGDINCTYTYPDGHIAAPLYQKAIDWLREKYAIIVTAYPEGLISYHGLVGRKGSFSNKRKIYKDEWANTSNYYIALEEAIEEALKLIDKN